MLEISRILAVFFGSSGIFIPQIVDRIYLSRAKQFYIKCKNGNGIFGNADLHFRMLALRIDFKKGVNK